MIKALVLAISCAGVGAVAAAVYVGRTEYSSPLRLSIPFGSSVKVTPDPSNVWSWHHQFFQVPGGQTRSADVLVDINGDQAMDTANTFLRVLITDFQISSADASVPPGIARIVDSQGRRLAVSLGGSNANGGVHHISLTTPIVLPVGSSLSVEVEVGGGTGSTFDVNMIGRVVNM